MLYHCTTIFQCGTKNLLCFVVVIEIGVDLGKHFKCFILTKCGPLIITSCLSFCITIQDLLWYMSKEVMVWCSENATDGSGSNAATTNRNRIDVHRNPPHPMATSTRPDVLEEDETTTASGRLKVQQVFSFWAPLIHYNDTIRSSLQLHYPPVTSSDMDGIQRHDVEGQQQWPNNNNDNNNSTNRTAWQSVDTANVDLVNHPPIAELMD